MKIAQSELPEIQMTAAQPTTTVAQPISAEKETPPAVSGPKPTRSAKNSSAVSPTQAPEHGYREVTDSEEAGRLLTQSLSLLTENLQKSRESMDLTARYLNDTFQETQNTLNRIL